MANNVIAFAFHLIIIIISFVFMIIFVATGPALGMYTTHIVSRLFFVILHIVLYVYAGTLLDYKKDKRYDFLTGIIIALIGIGLWIFTFSKTGMNLFKTPEKLSEYWIAYNLYYCPFSNIYFLLDVTATSPILNLFTNLLPSFLFGCGIKYKRMKEKRKQEAEVYKL